MTSKANLLHFTPIYCMFCDRQCFLTVAYGAVKVNPLTGVKVECFSMHGMSLEQFTK